ncbi:hypothetical protein [Pyrobaculum ferrireducens]|uniref:hypothetical protein n=1 Tax=Pyrobaculum ferrireducens TaxID=1104324 RepID=UPI001F201B55|nr:hypothetical protein [Pyrobaculum ferrireducens]
MDIKYTQGEIRLMSSGYGVLVALRQLARTMATPAKVGFFISVPQVLEIAEKLGVAAVPRNERQWFFEEVLKTAFDGDKLEEFLQELLTMVERHVKEVEALTSTYPGMYKMLSWSLERARDFRRRVEEVLAMYRKFQKLKEEHHKSR